MIFGCPVWGSVANTKGRKAAILLSLLVDFLAAVVSSLVTNFELFSICRFFSGFGIIGATSVVFSYLGEFLSEEHRDVLLGRLEIFWTYISSVFFTRISKVPYIEGQVRQGKTLI
nr:unnamed protein product [Callosobruchus analis]